MAEAMRELAIEAIIRGAWIRGYHKWETDKKSYFEAMHARNGTPTPNWKKIDGSHVDKQLALFSATPPESMWVIEETRQRVNGMKHEDSYLASQADYESLLNAVQQFWGDVGIQEDFISPVRTRNRGWPVFRDDSYM
jgi:hypothetical protein